MRVCSEEESTELPFIAERSKMPNTSKPTGRHNVFTNFSRDPNCDFLQAHKNMSQKAHEDYPGSVH